MSDDLLDSLLAVVQDEQQSASFENALSCLNNVPEVPKTKPDDSALNSIHKGDTDSSDDEDNRDFANRKYNDYGREIKHLLNSAETTTGSKPAETTKSKSWVKKTSSVVTSVNYEPLFGIRVVNPLVATNVLDDRMNGRQFVPLNKIKLFSKNVAADKDWVVVGVIVHKTATKTSQKGKSFSIWTLSDLKIELKTISLFLFGRAYSELWKTTVGTVVGVLNPSVLDLREGSKDEAHLSINNHQLLMLLGQSKDLGTCKSIKKNGEKCTAFVNLSVCEFCLFHIKAEYQKCSNKRSDLQSGYSGHGLNALRNKVLGKNQVFYAGKLYSAIPAKSNKQTIRDKNRLKVLDGFGESSLKKKIQKPKVAAQLELQANQRQRDLDRLRQLGVNTLDNYFVKFDADHSRDVSIEDSRTYALDVIGKLKNNPHSENLPVSNIGTKKVTTQNFLSKTPTLGSSTFVDLNGPIPRKEVIKARQNALAWVQNNGPIQKEDPNNIRGTGKAKKRALEDVTEPDEKKTKIQTNDFFSDRFKKMMAATSSHNNLLEDIEDERQQKYFQKLEMKERMEEKMSSTYKVPCKAVRCLKCKYTNFSASDSCKAEKHPLKVFDAVKRFFKCGNCSNRTACLSIVPTSQCKNCGSGKWERTTMMKDRTEQIAAPTLSIRGDEQTFFNSVVPNANLNLLVPE